MSVFVMLLDAYCRMQALQYRSEPLTAAELETLELLPAIIDRLWERRRAEMTGASEAARQYAEATMQANKGVSRYTLRRPRLPVYLEIGETT